MVGAGLHARDQLPCVVAPSCQETKRSLSATGSTYWGRASSAASALILSGLILAGRMDWTRAFAAWSPHQLSDITKAVHASLEVAFGMANGRLTPVTRMASAAAARAVWLRACPGACKRDARSAVQGTEFSGNYRARPTWPISDGRRVREALRPCRPNVLLWHVHDRGRPAAGAAASTR
jgi:hypothetical protein